MSFFQKKDILRNCGHHLQTSEKGLKSSTAREISVKLLDEEQEHRDNYVLDISTLKQDVIEADSETKDMLKMMYFQKVRYKNLSY